MSGPPAWRPTGDREQLRQAVLEQPDPAEGGPDWAITFADTMSLLMGFFVLLLSFSTFDEVRFKTMAGAVKSVFGGETPQPMHTADLAQAHEHGGESPLPWPAPKVLETLRGSIEALPAETRGALALKAFLSYRGAELALQADRVFLPGLETLRPEAAGLVLLLARQLDPLGRHRRVLVEVPCTAEAPREPQAEDAWGLAMARAQALTAALRAQSPEGRQAGGVVRSSRAATTLVPSASPLRGPSEAQVSFVFETPEVKPR